MKRMKRMKRRRGAMLALVGVLMVGLLSFLALVVDTSRMYTQKNELQTVADAASLAGLMQLYKDVYYVDDSAIVHGTRNQVQKQTITIDGADVICGVWVDTTDPQMFTPNPNGNCAATDNAVSVTAKAPAVSALPVILNVGSKVLSANAIAWGAFVDASDCVKPFGMQHQILTKRLQPGNPDTFRTLTALDLEKLRTLPIADLTFQLKYGSAEFPGNFGAIEMENPNAGGGGAEYKLNIAECNPTKFARGQILTTETGNKVGPTARGADEFCQPRDNGTGVCYNSSGGIGRVGKVITYLPPIGKCNGTKCELVIVDIVGFSMDKVTKDAEVFGHFLPLVSSGTITDVHTGIIRPVLVK